MCNCHNQNEHRMPETQSLIETNLKTCQKQKSTNYVHMYLYSNIEWTALRPELRSQDETRRSNLKCKALLLLFVCLCVNWQTKATGIELVVKKHTILQIHALRFLTFSHPIFKLEASIYPILPLYIKELKLK